MATQKSTHKELARVLTAKVDFTIVRFKGDRTAWVSVTNTALAQELLVNYADHSLLGAVRLVQCY